MYENDQFRPLVDLGEQLSGRKYGSDPVATRALRVLADHGRAMTFLIADGVVPSNEDRGYILRRVMRRAIQQGRSIGLESPFLGRFADKVIELMGDVYPDLRAERDAIQQWLEAEEESFGRTLEQGTGLLAELIERAKREGTSWIDAEDAFRLHDTYGFPYDLTRELLAEQGLSVDDEGFHELMEEQRVRARMGTATAHGTEDDHDGGHLRPAGRLSDSLRRLRDDRRPLERRGADARRRPPAGEVPREPVLPGGRRPGRRRREPSRRTPAPLASVTSSVSATTRPWSCPWRTAT